MKDLSMLVWLTQLGISVAAPLATFVLLALWLRQQFGLGMWIIWTALVLGGICAVSGFRQTLHLMEQMDSRNSKKQEPPIGFNDHV